MKPPLQTLPSRCASIPNRSRCESPMTAVRSVGIAYVDALKRYDIRVPCPAPRDLRSEGASRAPCMVEAIGACEPSASPRLVSRGAAVRDTPANRRCDLSRSPLPRSLCTAGRGSTRFRSVRRKPGSATAGVAAHRSTADARRWSAPARIIVRRSPVDRQFDLPVGRHTCPLSAIRCVHWFSGWPRASWSLASPFSRRSWDGVYG